MGAICKALRVVAGMGAHLGGGKAMHAQEAIHVGEPTAADYNTEGVKKLLTEKCEACGDCPTTARGLGVHQRQHDVPAQGGHGGQVRV